MKREYWRYLPAVFPYLAKYKMLLAFSLLLTIGGAVVALADPWPLAFLVDSGLGNHAAPPFITSLAGSARIHLIVVAVVAGFLVAFLIQGFSVITEYVNTKIDLSVSIDVRSDLFAHCQRLSQSFHENLTTGDFMYRINFEATQYGSMSVALLPLAQSALMLVGMFLVALRVDTTLALLALLVVPFVYYSIGRYGKHIEPRMIRVRNLETVSLTMVNTAMAMLRVITAFNRQGYEHQRFRAQGQTSVKARIHLTVLQTLFSMVVALLTAAGIGLVLFVGAQHVLSGALTIGQLLVLLTYINAMYQPLQTISSTATSFQQRLISIKFARRLFETQPDVRETPNAVTMPRAAGRVRFEQVNFDYPRRKGTLRDLNFEVQPGEAVAIVGVTGAGKSTLVSLIPRFMDPAGGRILIDGQDIHDATLHSVREQVGFVQQEPLLFPESILENIRYGKAEATFEEVVEAARQANAHDFIMKLPNTYETVLGERGAKISGGERQRITIARAFLKNAPILVLDEPTSSIDSRTEEVILEALDRLMQGRTTFIVAHRLSTVRRVDRVLVVDDGQLVEEGSPAELVRLGGLYAQFHALQTGQQPASVNGHKRVQPPAAPPVAATAVSISDSRVPTLSGRPKIVLLGMMSKMPVAGVIWQTVHYLLGFERLGYDAYYVEAHARTPSMLMRSADDDSSALAAGLIRDVMHRFDLDNRWCFHALHADGRCYGMTERTLRQLYHDAALIVNLHGGTPPRPEHSETGRLVYVETDPVQLQVELHEERRETLDFLDPHVAFFTFGENWGNPDCGLPVNRRYTFVPTRQPVVMALWETDAVASTAPFTTVANWHQQWRDITLDGEVYYWSKDREFRKFCDLPARTNESFELALAGCDATDRAMLLERGWRVRPADEISSDLDLYQRYLTGSRGEFTVAKDQNVRLRSGWFSDRSATYLAAGRPVITQDTGFGNILPTGSGLFAFSTLDEAAEAVAETSADWDTHSQAARDIAHEFFSADRVLGCLLLECGNAIPRVAASRASTSSDAALPRDLVIEPMSRQPVRLPEETVSTVLTRPVTSIVPTKRGGIAEPRASVVVVSFENLVFTRMCLETLLRNTDEPPCEVIVVDNGSHDGTVEYLAELGAQDPRVRSILNSENLGFAAAANIGLESARGEWLVLLNNDVLLGPNWLLGLTAHLRDWTVGMVGPLTNRAPGETRAAVDHRTYGEFLEHAAAIHQNGARREVARLPMLCVALRRAVFSEVGPLDSRFEVGMFEDDDYCARLHAAGYRLVCAEDVFVHHFGGASFGKLVSSGIFNTVFEDNRRRFEEKWSVTWREPTVREDPGYMAMKRKLRDLVAARVPDGAFVAVMSRGDEELLDLQGRRAVHFPQDIGGAYAGWYPGHSDEAIAQLARLRELGCSYLVVPASSAWWLDYYKGFAEHLERTWHGLATELGVGIVFGPAGRQEEEPLASASPSTDVVVTTVQGTR